MRIGAASALLLLLPAAGAALDAHLVEVEQALLEAAADAEPEAPLHLQECVNGMAGGVYPCDGIDLLEFMPVATFGATATNSGWGWTDPETGKEYYLLGLNNGTAFIDISDPEAAIYLGKLPTHTGTSSWRDVREYQNHAYIVADNNGAHGMQIFDLTQLRNVVSPPVTFTETAHYAAVTNVHTISINQETGYAYLAGSNTCSGGLHILNLANPVSPVFTGCWSAGAYVHENQCFVYEGPDTACNHDGLPGTPPVDCQGREICLAARGPSDRLDVVDVTNHAAPVSLGSLTYPGAGYPHQAWFTEDHRYALLNDETDESGNGHNTRTIIIDLLDLDAPVLSGGTGYFQHATPAIDHNLHVVGNYVVESNYTSGLRILELSNLASSQLTEVAFFDLYPSSNAANFNGTWNNYPFFASGVIPVTHISQGLFLLRPSEICLEAPAAPADLAATPNGDRRIDLDWSGSATPGATFRLERAPGGCDGAFEVLADELAAESFADLQASGGVTYGYRVRELRNDGACASQVSECVEASTTGACDQAPTFAGLASASNAAAGVCAVDLAWGSATPFCGGPVTFSIYRGADDTFVPSAANRIASGLTANAFADLAAPSATAYYVVHAVDTSGGGEDSNLTRRSTTPSGPPTDGTFLTGAEIGDPPLDGGSAFAPEHAGWHIDDVLPRPPSARSFWSTEGNNLCVTLEGDFSLSPGQSSTLSFYSAWDTEPSFDGGVVELSTNGGGSWTRLAPTPPYPGQIDDGGTLCGIAEGSGAFTGVTVPALTYQGPYAIDLGAWAGQNVRLRWLYRTDGGLTGDGWYVDDIALTHALVPGACVPALFRDGFETGSTAVWSLAAP